MPAPIIFEDLVIDRPLYGIFRDKNANVLGGLNQIQNLSITATSETKDKTDATGVLVKRFFTSKSVEISAENALFSLSLLGLQGGTEKEIGTASNKIVLPMIKQYAKTDSPITLDFDPEEGTLSVCGLKDTMVPDASLNYTLDVNAGPGKYSYVTATKVLTLPTDCSDYVQVQYEYQSENGAKVTVSADKFPAECELVLSVLVCDACDKEVLRHAYIVFPAFQMSPDFDITLDTDSPHPFSGTAAVDYCSASKTMFYIAISEDDTEGGDN